MSFTCIFPHQRLGGWDGGGGTRPVRHRAHPNHNAWIVAGLSQVVYHIVSKMKLNVFFPQINNILYTAYDDPSPVHFIYSSPLLSALLALPSLLPNSSHLTRQIYLYFVFSAFASFNSYFFLPRKLRWSGESARLFVGINHQRLLYY